MWTRRTIIAGAAAAGASGASWGLARSGAEEDVEGEANLASLLAEEFTALDRTVGGVSGVEELRPGWVTLKTPGLSLDVASSRPEATINFGNRDFSYPRNIFNAIKELRGSAYLFDEPSAPPPTWPSVPSDGMDTIHLSEFFSQGLLHTAETFTLNADHLALLAERNSFIPQRRFASSDNPRPVLVGLRGCQVVGGWSGAWQDDVRLIACPPSHNWWHCVIGAWDIQRRKVAFFPATTVPNPKYIKRFLSYKAPDPSDNGAIRDFSNEVCSVLPTGFYKMCLGRQFTGNNYRHNVFRQGDSFYPVLRSPKDTSFQPRSDDDVWTAGVAHHIHSYGRNADVEANGSAGCTVVPRYASSGGPSPWDSLRQLVGAATAERQPTEYRLEGDNYVTSSGAIVPFNYMLLTGAEAELAARHTEVLKRRYRRLRYGSYGSSVRELINAFQERLQPISSKINFILKDDSQFGKTTAMAALHVNDLDEGTALSAIVKVPM